MIRRIGHASLYLGTGDYISWWPKRKWYHIGFTFDANINRTFEDDVRDENDVQPEVYVFAAPLRYVLEAVRWRNKKKTSLSNRKNNLLHMNCCTLVVHALKKLFQNHTPTSYRVKWILNQTHVLTLAICGEIFLFKTQMFVNVQQSARDKASYETANFRYRNARAHFGDHSENCCTECWKRSSGCSENYVHCLSEFRRIFGVANGQYGLQINHTRSTSSINRQ